MSSYRHSVRLRLMCAASSIVLFPTFALADEPSNLEQQRDGVAQVDDIVVTGRSLSQLGRESSLPVQLLAGEELAHRRQGGLGETLAGLPGVHLDNFGGGASRPVIRGQTTPRIEILTDGANLFDVSSVSPDHAIIADPLLLDGIEILRGPAATRYGGNAMNGAINLIDSRVPKILPDNGLTGAVEARYGTGDEEQALAGRVTTAIGPFAFHIEGSNRDAEDYHVHATHGSERLKDSFAQGSSYSVGASWITANGYLGAAYSRQDSEYGLPGHSHEGGLCHTHGLDLHCESHDSYTDPFLGSDDSHTAYIKLQSERVDVRADYDDLLPGLAHTRLRLSYTDYAHSEIDGDILFSHYGNEVYDGRLELTHEPVFGFTGTFGLQYTEGTFSGLNFNSAHEDDPMIGFERLIDYATQNTGVFLSERRSFGALDVEIAARKDWREITIPVPNYSFELSPSSAAFLLPILIATYGPNYVDHFRNEATVLFLSQNPASKHEPFSLAASATWNLDDGYSASLSLSHTERAPSVREQYAAGNSLATNSLELGLVKTSLFSSSLPEYPDTMETTRAINLTFRKTTGATQFEIGLFHQNIDDYIFARLIEEETLESGALFRYLVYTPADATFTGLDGQISHQLNDASRVTLFGDYVRAELKNQNDNLPRIPPGRLGVRYAWESGPLSADAEYSRTFEQNRVASYETRTPGFDMLNATVSYRLDLGVNRSVDFYLRGTNLTNDLAYVHTSFVKDQSPMRGRNFVFGVRHRF